MSNSVPYPQIQVFVVLPAYNEEANLERLLSRIDKAMHYGGVKYQCLVVDDGSTDKTKMIAQECSKHFPVRVVAHATNQGLGATIRTGLKEATALSGDEDIIVTMDADDSHTPGLIVRMVRMLGEGYQVVIGSRFQPGAQVRGVPLQRQLLSHCASLVFRLLFPIPGVRDYTCGYRAYRSTVLKEAFRAHGDEFLSQDGFQCMVDILLWLRRSGVVIGETPMVLRYDFKEGQSKMKVFKTVIDTFKLIFLRLQR